MREGLTRTWPANKLSPVAGILNLYNWRDFIWLLTARDLRSRYVGSLGGFLWSIVQPLALIAVFSVLFTAIFKMNAVGGAQGYVIYLVAGLLPWNAFQEALQRSSGIYLENANLVKKMSFPLESLVAQAIAVSTVNLIISLVLLTVFMPLLGVAFSMKLLLVPVAVALQILLIAGPALTVATLSPFFRDVPPFTGMALFLGFWLTPVVYAPQVLPAGLHVFFKYNPVYHLIGLYRACFMGAEMPSLYAIAGTVVFGLVFCAVGWIVFAKFHRKIPEAL